MVCSWILNVTTNKQVLVRLPVCKLACKITVPKEVKRDFSQEHPSSNFFGEFQVFTMTAQLLSNHLDPKRKRRKNKAQNPE